MSSTADHKKTVQGDLDFATDRLSIQVRQIALGMIAIVWALLVGEIKGLRLGSPGLALSIAGLSIAVLLLDFCQYLAAYMASLRAYKEIKQDLPGKYKLSWPSYRLRFWFFRAKIALCLFTTLLFLGFIVWLLA